jgi:hypothetical protein
MSTSCVVSVDPSVFNTLDYDSEIMPAPVPNWVWCEVERLYDSVFSSKAMLVSDQNDTESLYAWIEKSLNQITDIFLFRKDGCVIQVANEVIHISPEVLRRFSENIFTCYPDVHFIRFHAVVLDQSTENKAVQASVFSEDYVLQLPNSKELWMTGLSARTREKFRSYLRRALNPKNEIKFFVYKQSQVNEEDVRSVLKLNQLRMQKKSKNYGMTITEENQLCMLMKKNGYICLLKANDEICAGLLCSVTGSDIYMHVLAHDPVFDKLRLGLVCCILTVEHLISHNFKRLHFLWGHYAYKKQLGAKPVDLSRVLVFKSLGLGITHPIIMAHWYANKARDLLRQLRHKQLLKIKT